VRDNYDRLHYPPDGVARDARYTRYLGPGTLLRTHTTAMLPGALRLLAASRVEDLLLVCPGLVYRRDCIDRLHTGEPHQMDLWRLWSGAPATVDDLERMTEAVIAASLPEAEDWRTTPAVHPYTEAGRQIDVRMGDAWIEIGECGLASPEVLTEAGLAPEVTGLAMGLGLDRLLMVRKGIDDIRLLRAEDPRIRGQLQDLAPYRPVSRQPPVTRDMSIAVDAGVDAEGLGDRVRVLLGDDSPCVEELAVRSRTPYAELPAAARARMGMLPSQDNVLLRLVLRHPDRTLTRAEANALRDRVYLGLHEGDVRELSPVAKH
jgi:phenylalanyl-tRNA synthetase alpha chain